jgi:AraC family transcriptional regulator
MPPKLAQGHFYGQVIKSRKVAGLILSETGYEPLARLPRHSHENAYLCLVRNGTYSETFGRRTRCCSPMTLAFHPAGEVHSEEFHDCPSRSFNVELEPIWLKRVVDYTGCLHDSHDFQGGSMAGLALKLYQEFHHTDEASPLVIEGLVLELVGDMSRKARPSNRRQKLTPVWVVRAWDMIQARFTEPLKVEDIAAEVGVHPIHLSCVFRKTYRCTIGEQVRRLRVEFAADQLLSTDLPLATIAHQSGFCSLSHLSVYFKKQMGLTPSTFRRSLRSG